MYIDQYIILLIHEKYALKCLQKSQEESPNEILKSTKK